MPITFRGHQYRVDPHQDDHSPDVPLQDRRYHDLACPADRSQDCRVLSYRLLAARLRDCRRPGYHHLGALPQADRYLAGRYRADRYPAVRRQAVSDPEVLVSLSVATVAVSVAVAVGAAVVVEAAAAAAAVASLVDAAESDDATRHRAAQTRAACCSSVPNSRPN
jgi:hypothetical protein